MTILPASAGIIGWPVAHSKSPVIHRFWLHKLGMDGDFSRFPVHPDGLAAALRGVSALGLRGVNVTVPHKMTAMAFLNSISDAAAAMGAVNVIQVQAGGRLHGTNTDVDGVAESVLHLDLVGRSVVIAGTGGAARAALAAMMRAGAGHVTLLARRAAEATALLEAAGQAGAVLPFEAPLPSDTALFFNATTLGMAGQPPLPVDLTPLSPETTVFDAVYAPLETPLLAAARARGMPVIDGLAMLVGQAGQGFEIFFGAPAPREHDAELRGLLAP